MCPSFIKLQTQRTPDCNNLDLPLKTTAVLSLFELSPFFASEFECKVVQESSEPHS